MPNTRSLNSPAEPGRKEWAGPLTAALASAALAFFSRALQASKSRRRFCRSRLSFCRMTETVRLG